MKLIQWLQSVLRGEEGDEAPASGETLFGLSVSDALRAHQEWVKRFEAALAKGGGDIDPDQVVHDDRCTLGKWILAQKVSGSSLASSPVFAELRETHTAFHRTASLLAQAVRSRSGSETRMLFEILRQKSRTIRIALARLLVNAQESGTGS